MEKPVDVELLVSLVHERPALWDRRHPKHANRYTVGKRWKDISAVMGVEELKLRKKWKYLRDQFAIELAKTKSSRSGDVDIKVEPPKWPHFHLLYFLKDAIKPRNVSKNTSSTADEMEKEVEYSPLSPQQELLLYSSNDEDFQQPMSSTFVDAEDEGEEKEILEEKPKHFESPTNTRKRKHDNTVTDALLTINEQNLEENAKRRREYDSEDEDLMFLKSLLPHIRKIPPYKKLQFRCRIQEIVEKFAYPSA